MDLLRKYLIPLYEAPDANPAAEPPAPPPAAADPAAVVAEPAPDAPPAPQKMVPVDVMIREVTPLRAKAREAEERPSGQSERPQTQEHFLRDCRKARSRRNASA